jgi:hypothetical protein
MSGVIILLPSIRLHGVERENFNLYLISNVCEPFETQIKVWTYSWLFKSPNLGRERVISFNRTSGQDPIQWM